MPSSHLTFFVHLTATAAWRSLTRRERQAVIAEQVTPLLGRHPQVAIQWFDAQAWSAEPSDILMARTADPRAWSELFEQLRATSLWTLPYFEIDRIVPAVESSFGEHQARDTPSDQEGRPAPSPNGAPRTAVHYQARHGSRD